MSSVRTSMTEVYQSGPTTLSLHDCGAHQNLHSFPTRRSSDLVHTDLNGVVKATVQGIATVVNTSVVTLLPLSDPTTQIASAHVWSQVTSGWRMRAAAGGTTVSPKYLPGSCRG